MKKKNKNINESNNYDILIKLIIKKEKKLDFKLKKEIIVFINRKKRRKCIQKLDKNIIIDNQDKNKMNKKKDMNLLIFQNLTFQIMK